MSLRFSASLALLLVPFALACSGNNGGPDSGPDSGVRDGGSTGGSDGGHDAGLDAGPHYCGSIGANCPAVACCGNLSCGAGTCQPSGPICAGYAEPCGGGVSCCGGDGGPLACISLGDGGLSLCISGGFGAPCASSAGCAAPTSACQDGGPGTGAFCTYPSTGTTCTSGPCQPGDDCTAAANAIYNTRQATAVNDPCFASGLTCTLVGNNAVCVKPPVAHPPSFPNTGGSPFDDTVCNLAGASCVADPYGASRTAQVCGSYFVETTGFLPGNNHCLDKCAVDDDCSSLAEQCVGGVCVPDYCFAAGTVTLTNGMTPTLASFLSPASVGVGGSTVSADPTVLFNPCPSDGGTPTACLPQYDQATNGSAGWCVRVGTGDAGGWGALCDPSSYRNNPSGYCAPGNFCDKGTCLPWCDLGTTAFLQCPANTACSRLPGGSVLNSTSAGVTNSLGVCTQPCNPYLDSTQNSCEAFPLDGGQPHQVCKFSESQNDMNPPPGMCLAGVEHPLAIGQPCSPFGWVDPCVSGAQCVSQSATTDGGALGYVCAQLCDPHASSAAVNAPACPAPTTCQAFLLSACQGNCAHEGACQ